VTQDPTAVEAEARRLAEAQLVAYNARDVDAFVACYAEDVEIHTLAEGKLVAKGRDAMRQSYGKMFAANPRLHCVVVSRIVMGRFAIDEERIDGHPSGDGVRATAIYETGDGLIKKVWFLRP
jgi:hypothetical protein